MTKNQPGALDASAYVAIQTRQSVPAATVALAGLAMAKVSLHLAGIRQYGFFRDELYYMACGEHLAWGYVDQPPLIAFVAWFERHLLGDSIVSVRILSVLAGAAVVFFTGLLARELGGGRYAQLLAAAGVLFAPAYLAFNSFLSMNAFEPLFWLLCAWFVVRIVKGASPRLWLVAGVVAGIGLENKHTMLVFVFAILLGLLLSGQQQLFRCKWFWISLLIAFALFLPNLVWEARHGWPQIQVVRNAQLYKNIPFSLVRFLIDQTAFLNPLALPVWLGGLAWCFLSRGGKRFRFLGWTYLIVLAIFVLLHGKSYYVVPTYTLLMAAGGVAVEAFTASRSMQWVRITLPVLLVIAGLIAVPFGIPLLPINSFLRYSRLLPFSEAAKTERDAVGVELPQLYADMFGWPNMAETIAGVYAGLPQPDRSSCAILAGNYGEAGAVDYYGPPLGLPKALSGHNSYYDWGPQGYSGACVIIFGERSSEFITLFGDVHQAGTIVSPHAMPNERVVPVYICRMPRAPLSVLWPHFKMII